MRRIVPLLVVAACPLAALVAGCDGGSAEPDANATVAVATLPPTLPMPSAPATSAPASEPTPPTTDRATTTTVASTRFAALLGDVVGGEPAAVSPTDVVVDDTHRLRMEVPQAWSDRRTAPSPLAEGGEAPYLAAAPDQTKFLDGFGAPGLTAVVVDAAPPDALDAYTFDACTSDGRSPFSSGHLSGLYEVWRDCAERGSAIVTVAARQAGTPGTVLVLAQVVEPSDLAALDQALATIRLGAG